MKKKLYKNAFISSPILALYGVAPAYILNKIEFSFFALICLALTVNIFIFWNIHILILTTVKHTSWKRYLLCYLLPFCAHAFFISIGFFLKIEPPELNILYPILASVAINTIIIILSNSIIFQFQKETAEVEIEQLKVKNLEAQKQVLLQQLQPHFLFNALSTLKSLISESPLHAADYTVRLSEFLRYSVQAKNNEVVTVSDELGFTQDYIQLQKVRFGEALQVTIEISEQHLQKKVPVYALQTLVENAIKHNAFTDKKPLCIHIFSETDCIRIQNNRLPKRLQLPSGTGLKNLQQRYQLISNASILVEKGADFFTVSLNLL